MCGRYTLTDPGEELIRHFQLPGLPQEYTPRYNIAPTQQVLAIIDNGRAPSRDAALGAHSELGQRPEPSATA